VLAAETTIRQIGKMAVLWGERREMSMKTVVTMGPDGRVTVPAAARKALRVAGETQFELEVSENELVLRPALVIPREDAWAYAPEHLASVARARQQLRDGRVREATEADFAASERLATRARRRGGSAKPAE
jgi:bifunctional DNA-binding transcriptional regulator/antitoxin component of YhaV-PrlF toxin-antitoxin module